MKNLFQRLQARKKERRSAAAGDDDVVVHPQKQQPPESRIKKMRWNKKRERAATAAKSTNPAPAAVVVSAFPDEIPRSVTLETRDANSFFSSGATTHSTSTGGGERQQDQPSNTSLSRRSCNSLDQSHRSAYSDITMRHREYDGGDDDDDNDESIDNSSQNDNTYFEVDYRGHYVEKATPHEAILKLALDASACVTAASSSRPVEGGDASARPPPSNNQHNNNKRVSSSLLDKSGNDLFEQGNIDQAVCKYEEALKVKRQALLGQYNALRNQKGGMSEEQRAKVLASVATSINNLTYLRQVKGQASAEETLASYETALEIKRDILGPDHLSVGKTLNNIGSVHYMQRNYHAAAESYEQARDILKLNLGENHLDICTVTSNLGDVHYCLQQWNRAVLEYRAALQLRWKLLGPSDPKVVRLMEQIAELEMKIIQIHGADDDGSDYMSESEAYFDGGFETLQAEIDQEIRHLDSLQKQAPLDMVKEKTRVFRELRELRGEEGVVVQVEDNDESGQRNFFCSPDKVSLHPSMICTASEKQEDRPHHETPSVKDVSPVSVVPDSPIREREEDGVVSVVPDSAAARKEEAGSTTEVRSESNSTTPRHLTAEERLHALSSVKSRLAKLRADRSERSNIDSPPVSPTTPLSKGTEKSKLSPSQLLKTSELLTIKQGIHSLRSGPAAASQTKRTTDLSSSLIEASSLARKRSMLAEKRRITQRTTRPSHCA